MDESQRRVAALARHLNSATTAQTKMLEGVTVIELATVVAAPVACALLCDAGAKVIKIENPLQPDIARAWGRGDKAEETADEVLRASPGGGGSAFTHLNRGKQSVALDPTTAEGKPLLRRLLSTADIFVTNVRQQSLEKMGLDFDTLRCEFPTLIYGHLTAWGRAGRMRNDPGYDFGAFWAYSGVQDIIRSSPESPMPRFPGAIGDHITGNAMYGSLLGALYHRERTGEGQLVDAALLRAGVWSLAHPIMQLAGGNAWASSPSGDPSFPSGPVRETTELGVRRTTLTNAPYRCRDGKWLQLMGLETARHLPGLLTALRLEPKHVFGKTGKITRSTDWAAATRAIDAVMATKDAAEWEQIFEQAGVWHKPINGFDSMLSDEQANAAGCFVKVPGLRHPLVSGPVLLSACDTNPTQGAPCFGAHTDTVLRSIGCDDAEITELRARGIVA